ncbi:MAG: hypothetical protein WDN25_00835 [Acetobacteraceae bacterium]
MTTAISPAIAGIATAADVDRAVAALTLAFSTDPVARWMYAGDPCAYLTHFPHFVRAFGGKAFAAGTAFGAEDGSGVALWLPPGMHVDGAAVDALLERTLAPERHATMGATFDQMVAVSSGGAALVPAAARGRQRAPEPGLRRDAAGARAAAVRPAR